MTMAGTVQPRLLGALALPGGIVLACFFILPVCAVAYQAVAEDPGAFVRLLSDPVFWISLRGSLALGTLAPLASVAVGTAVAMHLAGMPAARRLILVFLLSLPLTFSGLIIAYGFILVFGRAGFLTMLLAHLGVDPAWAGQLIYSPAGVGFAYTYYLVPRVVMIVLPPLLNFDRGQIAAARSLGASPLRATLDILLPQLFPSLLAAFCLTAAVAFGAYGTALALAGTQLNILPLWLYSKISDTGSDFAGAAALSVLLMGVCCLVIAGAEAASRRVAGAASDHSPRVRPTMNGPVART
jgi:putative spermidine/putrescine transport system permease protein